MKRIFQNKTFITVLGCILASAIIIGFFLILFKLIAKLPHYECTSNHIEAEDIIICNGNLYHKVCRTEQREKTICDEYIEVEKE